MSSLASSISYTKASTPRVKSSVVLTSTLVPVDDSAAKWAAVARKIAVAGFRFHDVGAQHMATALDQVGFLECEIGVAVRLVHVVTPLRGGMMNEKSA
jgi:hypothetical protein